MIEDCSICDYSMIINEVSVIVFYNCQFNYATGLSKMFNYIAAIYLEYTVT